MHILTLITVERLTKQAGATSFGRGTDYARDGRVSNVQLLPGFASGRVDGQEPYFVVITEKGGKLAPTCTCPLGISGVFCKHCVALCLIAAELVKPTVSEATGPLFKTDAELEGFIERHRLEHVRQLCGEVLLPYFAEPEQSGLRYVLSRARLVDLATPQALKRYGYYLQHAYRAREQLPCFARRFLEAERDDTERARAQVRFRTRTSAEGMAGAFIARLLAFRGTFDPSLAPLPDEKLNPERLTFDSLLPGFHYEAERA